VFLGLGSNPDIGNKLKQFFLPKINVFKL